MIGWHYDFDASAAPQALVSSLLLAVLVVGTVRLFQEVGRRRREGPRR